jgi:hypothetical protein
MIQFANKRLACARLSLSGTTLKRYRTERVWIEGIHWVRLNSRCVRYNLEMVQDWLQNRHDPAVHWRNVEMYQAQLLSNQNAKKTKKRQHRNQTDYNVIILLWKCHSIINAHHRGALLSGETGLPGRCYLRLSYMPPVSISEGLLLVPSYRINTASSAKFNVPLHLESQPENLIPTVLRKLLLDNICNEIV